MSGAALDAFVSVLTALATLQIFGIFYLAIALSKLRERIARVEGYLERHQEQQQRATRRDYSRERGPLPAGLEDGDA